MDYFLYLCMLTFIYPHMRDPIHHHPLTVCRASAGTGKTFTLAAYYIALLLSGESYRNILAVTFTNAATAEMKERILTYLLGIAGGGEREFLAKVREFMLRDGDKPDEELQSRADDYLHAILQDYDNFSVTTIDSFLQQLIRGLAQAINRTADFAISLDAEQVITTAVDTMLTTELDAASKRTVYEYVEECIGDGKSWDIRQNLIRIGLQLYMESVQANNTSLNLDEKRIAAYRSALIAKRKAAMSRFRPLAMQAKSDLDAGVAYTKGKNAKTAIENIYKSVINPDAMESKDLLRGATDKGLDEVMSVPELRMLQQECDKMRHTWWQVKCSLTYLNDMRLMQALSDSIQRSLLRTNTSLLAETAITLAEALKPGDADFVLEKAGIRYRHIMIDEFQDTSLLQWNVFLHLIREIVSVPGQTVLIVGDSKQSIYRFRNGNWQIMESLGKTELVDAFNPDAKPLIRNQRSRENVVRFNLGVMQHVAAQDNLQYAVSDNDKRPVGTTLYDEQQAAKPLTDYYRTDKHQGGFVRCRFYPYYSKTSAAKLGNGNLLKPLQQEALWDDVCSTIEQLLALGEQPQDILVLAQKNNQIQEWVTWCREQGARFPLLNSTQMVSRDSFKLESSTTVLMLIEALRYIHTGSESAAAFLRLHRENDCIERIEAIDKSAPLYDQLQHLIQIIACEQGVYQGNDIAYVNCFLDQVQSFIAANGSDTAALLQYWNDKMHDSAIAGDSNSDAIRLMTVHSSKGLEGKTVILLDAAWSTEHDRNDDVLWTEAVQVEDNDLSLIPVKQSSDLQRTGEQSRYYRAYRQEHEAQRIDNYNLLYVALTRAADNLYVYALTDANSHKKGYPTVAASLLDYCELREAMATIADSDDTYLQFCVGDEPFINRDERKTSMSPFDYASASKIPSMLYSDGTQVTFRQSQESTEYTLDPDNADTATAQADFGILCHDIFAHIARRDDTRQVLELYRQQGLIDSDEQLRQIAALIDQAFTNPQMQQWFDGSWQLMREVAILTPNTNIRPDRVMIRGDQAVVLDYKFTAQQHPRHIRQVRDYMAALRDIGYTRVEGWLWYAFPNQLVQVNF